MSHLDHKMEGSKTKKIKLKLVGTDGNAFSLLALFRRQARKEGWTETEITEVLNKAMSGDYSNLLSTLSEHCVGGGF